MPNGNIAPVEVLPPDDGSIERGLAELDARLAAWLAAFKRAMSMLPGGGAASGSAAALSEAIAAKAKAEPARSKVLDQATVEAAAARRKTIEATPAPRRGEETAGPVVDEDETLLAALDPEVRKQVHIRRRMSNNGKSIRELIEEVRSAKPAAEISKTKSNTRRKWW